MRLKYKVLTAVLIPVIASMGILPQMASAHTHDAVISQYKSTDRTQLPFPFTSPLAYAKRFLSTAEARPENDESAAGPLPAATIASEPRSVAALTAAQAPALNRGVRNPRIDVDEMIATSPAFPAEGLVLTTAKNTWESHPQSHEEMLRCVERDSFSDPDWFGASLVGEVNQIGNIHGNGEYYVSRYEAFLFASGSGEWTFATDSEGASEIEIDGQ